MRSIFGFFSEIWQSNFGAEIQYVKLRASVYLLVLVMVILGAFYVGDGCIRFNEKMSLLDDYLQTDFPDFTVKNGVFTCSNDTVYKRVRGGFAIIVDPGENPQVDILDAYPAGYMVNRTAFVVKSSKGDINTIPMKDINFDFAKSDVMYYIEILALPVLTFLFIAGVLFVLFAKFIGVLLVSLLALIANAVLKAGVGYRDLFKISIFAVIYPSILDYSLSFFNIHIPWFNFLYYAFALFFVVKFLLSAKAVERY